MKAKFKLEGYVRPSLHQIEIYITKNKRSYLNASYVRGQTRDISLITRICETGI